VHRDSSFAINSNKHTSRGAAIFNVASYYKRLTAVMQLINGFRENGNAIPTQIELFVLDMEID
jgi:hypothetical protein